MTNILVPQGGQEIKYSYVLEIKNSNKHLAIVQHHCFHVQFITKLR